MRGNNRRLIPRMLDAVARASSGQWRRGHATKNVVAFSLWGDRPMYWVGARRNIELVREFYPGFVCRFYVDRDAPGELIESLSGDDVEVELRTRTHELDGMFWRFAAASDPEVDIALVRDCDSRIGRREVAAVQEWLRSSKDFHIMRDHPWHSAHILGGMWGCRRGILKDLDKLSKAWPAREQYGCDQAFLAGHVYPMIAHRAMEHSEFGVAYGAPTRPFPTPRQDHEFVGEVFDEHDRRNEEHRRIIVEASLHQRS